MENERTEALHPSSLPLGTQVGPWRVVGWAGRGTYGAVYRAVRVGQEKRGSVALKLAVQAEDPRFEREAKLLSLLRGHPNVPELYEYGQWRNEDRDHPYLAMQWVEGVSLYKWAAARNPTSRQLLQVLAQLAWAVGTLHAVGGVHRDVKGDNVLIRLEDEQVFLVDLGLVSYPGAPPVTFLPLPPGTEAYRSPEAWRFAREHGRTPGAHYEAQPADDVFALGVTAYRLVTDEYPPPTDPGMDTERVWREGGAGPRPPGALNPRLNSWLSVLILRMLSVRPELRGSAVELAEMLQQEAEQADAEAALPAFAWETQPREAWSREDEVAASVLGHRPGRRVRSVVYAAEEKDFSARAEAERLEAEAISRALALREVRPPWWERHRARMPWLMALSACVGMLTFYWTMSQHYEPREQPALAQEVEAREREPENGTARVAEEVSTPPEEEADFQSADAGVTDEVPPKPFEGQRRPDSKGKCGGSKEAINGGCWVPIRGREPPCNSAEDEFEWKGACYVPALGRLSDPNSAEP
jgi:predicted Ser/Thr protein kinase